jgi:DNA repair protein RecN (Recombination protein N)
MLDELRIQNFAIIDHLELTFASGFNVITGETGAGKSIIVDAVELLLGGKADPAVVRAGAERTLIEGTFALNDDARVAVIPILQREDLMEQDPTDYFVTLSREIRSNGRSAARINGTTVSQDVLREVGEALVDIHGQSEHLSLLKPRFHVDLLDRYADLLEVRSAFAKVVDTLTSVREEIRRLQADKDELQRRAERLHYAFEEIDAAELHAGEDDELLAERNRLANSEQLAKLTVEAVELLNAENTGEGQMPVVDQVMQVASLLGKLVKIDPDLKNEYDLAESICEQAQELAIALSRYADTVEYNPDRLNEVEERLELINSLKRRYGATIPAVLEYAERARAELNGIEHSEERLNELGEQEAQLLKHLGELGLRISRGRAVAGQKLGRQVVAELQDLRMERTRFEVDILQREDPDGCYVGDKRLAFDSTGIDTVEFMMSANPGEPLRPLAKVASGGETARIMLALKRVLTQADRTPTLIFDEIDQGIGGRVGSVVGEKLWALSNGHQVLVVTHLAQLASYADNHYQVKKLVSGNRTSAQVIVLESDEQRVAELADMLGATGESGKQSAQDLLNDARQHKSVRAADGKPPPEDQKKLL